MRTAAMLVLAFLMGSGFAGADSLFSEDTEKKGSLVSDGKQEFEVGDIITVLVRESVDASATADTTTNKETENTSEAEEGGNSLLTAPKPTGFGIMNAAKLPNWDFEWERDHQAQGETARSNTLTMTVACQVTKVHDNGNIDIEGAKKVKVNREDTTMVIKGTVRSRDVTPANTVDSTQLAGAFIGLEGKGPLWNNQRRGLLTKLLDWVSPF